METTRTPRSRTLLTLACMALACPGVAAQSQAAEPPGAPPKGKSGARAPAASVGQRVEMLRRQLGAQGQQIEALQKQLAEQEARYRELQERLVTQEARNVPPPPAAAPAVRPVPGVAPAQTAQSVQNPQGTDDASTRQVRVGVAPSAADTPPPPVAQLFDEPSILTPRGHYVLEPSLQYGYSSNNRVALVGYTIIPALLIGLVDVREFKQNTFTAALTGRWGVGSKMELELKVPYVSRSDATISREIFTGSASDSVFNSRGSGIGDVELAARYQIFSARESWPYLVGALRFKSHTGTDPFSVVTDCVTRCVGNATGTGLPMELPTGSGFYSLQPSLTWLLPADPAVFFGGLSYTYNFGRSDVSRQVLGGQRELLGDVKPGDIFGMNFGMGLALNERSSFSLGFELYSVGPTKQNDQTVAGSVRTQLASLLLGYSYRFSPKYTLNVSVGAGLTRDTPDLMLTVRMPLSF